MSNDNTSDAQPIQLAPSDLLGIIQRKLLELNAYLGQAPTTIEVQLCKQHLSDAYAFLERFEQSQMVLMKQQGSAPQKEMTN